MGTFWILVLTSGYYGGASSEEINYRFSTYESCKESGLSAKKNFQGDGDVITGFTCIAIKE